MPPQLIVIIGFMVGAIILFFDFKPYDVADQEYRWLPYARRRSMRFSVLTFIALALAWFMSFYPLVHLLITLAIFFVMMDVLLTIGLRVRNKKEREERKKGDQALELLRKSGMKLGTHAHNKERE